MVKNNKASLLPLHRKTDTHTCTHVLYFSSKHLPGQQIPCDPNKSFKHFPGLMLLELKYPLHGGADLSPEAVPKVPQFLTPSGLWAT